MKKFFNPHIIKEGLVYCIRKWNFLSLSWRYLDTKEVDDWWSRSYREFVEFKNLEDAVRHLLEHKEFMNKKIIAY